MLSLRAGFVAARQQQLRVRMHKAWITGSSVRQGGDRLRWPLGGKIRAKRGSGLVRGLVCVLCAAWILATPGFGAQRGETSSVNDFRLTHWTTEHGLPQNTISALLQTQDGYLWIGTRYGLARYDGVRFADFTPELSGMDERNLNVLDLAQDREGQVWALTGAGFSKYSWGRFQYVTDFTNAPPGQVFVLHAGRRGGLWASGMTNLFHVRDGVCDRSFTLARDLGIPDATGYTIDDFFEAEDGGIWVRTLLGSKYSWWRWDPASGTIFALERRVDADLGSVGGFNVDQRNGWWMAGPNRFWYWREGHWERHDNVPWGAFQVHKLVIGVAGDIWLTTDGPVQLHRYSDGQFTSFGPETGLVATYDLRDVLADREGNFWAGTGRHGLYRVQPRKLVTMLDEPSSEMDEVYSVAPGHEGRVWLATTYGLVKYEGGKLSVITNTPYPDKGLRVRPVFETTAGEVLFNLDFKGLHRLVDGRFEAYPLVEPMPHPGERLLINSFCEDVRSNVWMATPRGLGQLQNGRFRLWTEQDGLKDNRTYGLACGADGTVWVGSFKSGVHRFKDGQFRCFSTREGLLNKEAWPLKVEPDGTVWIGTPLGLNRIRGDEVRSVTMREGLFDNLAYCLLEDEHTNYWTFCNRGIWRVKKPELHAAADGKTRHVHCVTYGEAEGMVSAEGNGDQQPNAAVLPDGKFWFPTTRGVVILDPDDLRENRVPPPVAIEEVRANDDLVFRDGGYLPLHAVHSANLPLRLPPGHARVLEIRYTATTFIDSEKTQFRFRLEGADVDWRDADTRRVAYYTDLRPGSYKFVVEARNQHGYWSSHPAEFHFAVAPYFYQTWFFYAGCAALLGAVLWTLHLRRLNARSRGLQIRQERALIAERDRISRDLHDDLGSSLTGIALGLDVTRQNLHHPHDLESRLDASTESLRQLVTRLRDVVWSLNPRCDTLDSFCAYLSDYAETFLAAAGLHCRWDLPVEIPELTLNAESRYQLLLITKEALNNVVKHARATEVRVSLRLDEGEITLIVVDNGRGFPGSVEAVAGNGLRNMAQRATALRGSCQIDNAPGGAARVTLRFPRPKSQTL